MFNCYDWQTNPVAEITRVKKMYEEQLVKVNNETYIKDLLYADYVAKVKSNRSRYDMFSKLFYDAQKQVDKKKKSERKELALLEGFIREDFLNDDKNFKLTGMIMGGYEGYYWNIEFEFHDKKFYISIPAMDRINIDNFKFAHDGKFCFYVKESECSWYCKGSSYKIADVAKCIKEYFNLDADKHE